MENIVVDTLQKICFMGEVSVCLIQRKFRIGYVRAAKFIDKLAEEKIIKKQQAPKPWKILNKKKFLEIGEQYFSGLYMSCHPDVRDIINRQFPTISGYEDIAENLIKYDCFAKKVDEIFGSKFLAISNEEERRECFHLLVYSNHCRMQILSLIVNDFISKALRENLDYTLDEYWLKRVKNYRSFLGEKRRITNENNESVRPDNKK